MCVIVRTTCSKHTASGKKKSSGSIENQKNGEERQIREKKAQRRNDELKRKLVDWIASNVHTAQRFLGSAERNPKQHDYASLVCVMHSICVCMCCDKYFTWRQIIKKAAPNEKRRENQIKSIIKSVSFSLFFSTSFAQIALFPRSTGKRASKTNKQNNSFIYRGGLETVKST